MITIIGAGPAGCFCAYKLAKKGFAVQVFEEHPSIGKPVQCTGIVTSSISKIIGAKDKFMVNKIRRAQINSPGGGSISIKLDDIVLDREKFDLHIEGLAEKAGAVIYRHHKFIDFKKRLIIKDKKEGKIKELDTDILIGADGPVSQVAKVCNLRGKREYYIGIQARVKKDFDPGLFKVTLGSSCPGFFSWTVPESDTIARVGLAVRRYPYHYFEKLVKGCKPHMIEKQAGLIPIYDPDLQICKENVFLVGDAAHQVKASTGGGIIPGLKAAEIAADCIINKKDYAAECKEKLGKDLWLHLKIRKVLDNFSDKDYSLLIALLKKRGCQDAMERYSRDSPKMLLFKILSSEPRLFYFMKNIF